MLGRFAGSFALAGALLLLGLPDTARAQMREFTGRVDEVAGATLVVGNRMGDKMSFARSDETVVQGAKSGWSDLAADDRVTISWKFVDKPRKAYVVKVHENKPKAP